MKSLQIFGLVLILVLSATVFGQEKESEKPKEAEKAKEVKKPKEKPEENLSNIFRTGNNQSGFIVTHQNRKRPIYLPPVADVTNVEVVVSEVNKEESEENICLPSKILEVPGEVTTTVHNPLDDALTYAYTVTGGKIIGQGKKVFWDLSGVKPGTYTITAAVDDGCGFCGRTVTKTVIVKE